MSKYFEIQAEESCSDGEEEEYGGEVSAFEKQKYESDRSNIIPFLICYREIKV